MVITRENAPEAFRHIFSEGRLGPFTVNNRIKYAACSVSNFNDREGFVTEREYGRDQVIASTGASIMTNQGAYPDRKGEGKAYYKQLSINDDRYIPGLRRIADLFHDNGALAIQQVLHGGRYGGIDLDYALQPSDTPQTLRHFRPPREMTPDEIAQAIEDHSQAAARSIRAGYDGVEVTSFMGYLMACFLSPFTNQRTDAYGGTLEKRARFMVEILQGMRKAVGPDKLVIIRLNGTELMDEFGGNSEDECVEIMRIAADCGVDMISMVIGWHESREGALGRDVSRTHWLYLAEKVKKVIGDVPLAFGPRLSDPWEADRALGSGVFDYWEICRPFLADPELAHKLARNQPERIKPCIGGLLCLAKMFANQPYMCAVNPRLGHEWEPEYTIRPAVATKKVMVVGGGAAGMEAAIAATKRGHNVALFEASHRLGGALHAVAQDIGGGGVMLELLDYYRHTLADLGVDVRLGTPVDRRVAADFFPDVIVVATGASVAPPAALNGNGADVRDVHEVLGNGGLEAVGRRVVVLGGGKAGLICAEALAQAGRQVTIVEAGRRVDHDVLTTFKWRHAGLVQQMDIAVHTEAHVLAVEPGTVRIRDQQGQTQELPADSVVLAGPRRPNQRLLHELEYSSDELYVIGDAMAPRHLHNAIHDGFKLGARI